MLPAPRFLAITAHQSGGEHLPPAGVSLTQLLLAQFTAGR
jgi:hypothetical protein